MSYTCRKVTLQRANQANTHPPSSDVDIGDIAESHPTFILCFPLVSKLFPK